MAVEIVSRLLFLRLVYKACINPQPFTFAFVITTMKQFTIPFTYRSSLISAIKNRRKEADKMKKDFSPTLLDFGAVQIFLARHFGFCYGVENAIEIAFRTIES